MAQENLHLLVSDIAKAYAPAIQDSVFYKSFEEFLLTTDEDYIQDFLYTNSRDVLVFSVLHCLSSENSIDDPFRPIIGEAVQFFNTCLGPFCYAWSSAYSPEKRKSQLSAGTLSTPEMAFWDTLQVLGRRGNYFFGSDYIEERWKSGLLRPGQVKILEAVMKADIDQLRLMMLVDPLFLDEYYDEEWLGMVYLKENYEAMFRFFASFRSERIENAILRYLGENDVNNEVCYGVNSESIKYRQELDRFLNGRGQLHSLARITVGSSEFSEEEVLLFRTKFQRVAVRQSINATCHFE
ncbi:hypothetical protein BJ508DRAFT_418333 [Ascobolus immersus RN42]|uniref:Uncharacterized protein n=1 Tax=Ascobolus immersus RN42 TaxID=1160509 RepID=A0A3N4HZF0_ASCIM|nr:hypothetical protein BJ508DRAFT_418333 [Ascobolus immersus RN42]